MKITDVPSRFNIPFANSAGGGYIRAIPEASQVGIQDGAASLTTGWPPLNFLPVGAGGVPPFGQDFNGLMKQVTQWSRWQAAGGLAPYNADFSTAIGGYPKNAVLMADSTNHLWLNLVDDNTTDPDAAGANWMPLGLAATQPEVDAGVRDDVFVTPETLAGNGPSYANLTATMPIFFNIENTDGHLSCTSPSTGVVRVPAGKVFTWRGVRQITTVQSDLPTTASKTYHLRWTNGGGFALFDLANVGYNPTAAAETSPIFDTTYDSMLVARVVTNGSNVLTITNLVNFSTLNVATGVTGTDHQLSGTNGANALMSQTLNWSRVPKTYFLAPVKGNANSAGDADTNMFDPVGVTRTNAVAVTNAALSVPVTRYGLAGAIMIDGATLIVSFFTASA